MGFLGGIFGFITTLIMAPFKIIGSALSGALGGAPEGAKWGGLLGLIAGAFTGWKRSKNGEDANVFSSAVGGAFTGAITGGVIGAGAVATKNTVEQVIQQGSQLASNADQVGSSLVPPPTPNANQGQAPRRG